MPPVGYRGAAKIEPRAGVPAVLVGSFSQSEWVFVWIWQVQSSYFSTSGSLNLAESGD